MCQSAPCGQTNVRPREVVEKIIDHGWKLVKPDVEVILPNRQKREVGERKSLYCNWTIDLDDNVDRFPRYLPKAVCENCPPYCEEIDYHHKVLIRDCSSDLTTHRRKIDVWKWETVALPVAFVYNP